MAKLLLLPLVAVPFLPGQSFWPACALSRPLSQALQVGEAVLPSILPSDVDLSAVCFDRDVRKERVRFCAVGF